MSGRQEEEGEWSEEGKEQRKGNVARREVVGGLLSLPPGNELQIICTRHSVVLCRMCWAWPRQTTQHSCLPLSHCPSTHPP